MNIYHTKLPDGRYGKTVKHQSSAIIIMSKSPTSVSLSTGLRERGWLVDCASRQGFTGHDDPEGISTVTDTFAVRRPLTSPGSSVGTPYLMILSLD